MLSYHVFPANASGMEFYQFVAVFGNKLPYYLSNPHKNHKKRKKFLYTAHKWEYDGWV